MASAHGSDSSPPDQHTQGNRGLGRTHGTSSQAGEPDGTGAQNARWQRIWQSRRSERFLAQKQGVTRRIKGYPTEFSQNSTASTATRRRPERPLRRRGGALPYYSLAGPPDSGYAPSSVVYVHAEYRMLNPRYGKGVSNNDVPIWGLAKLLPRVVRPEMRKAKEEERGNKPEANATIQKGEEEPAPELKVTPSRPQKEGEAEEGGGEAGEQSNVAADMGIPYEQAVFPVPEESDSDRTVHPIETEVGPWKEKGTEAEP
ncbi:hypothetical protein VTO42DRAFT_6130 [Malbranchea cinnamomea]